MPRTRSIASSPASLPIVAVVESHGVWRRGLVEILQELGYPTRALANGAELVQCFLDGDTPVLAFVQLNMPVMDGYVVLNWLREHQPAVHALAMAYQPDDAVVRKCMRSGAAGVICCTLQPEELTKALHDVQATGHLRNALFRRLFQETKPTLLARGTGKLADLSPQELRYVKLKCAPDLPSDATVARRMKVALSTVRTYRKRVYAKLGVKNHAALVRMAIARGWVKE